MITETQMKNRISSLRRKINQINRRPYDSETKSFLIHHLRVMIESVRQDIGWLKTVNS